MCRPVARSALLNCRHSRSHSHVFMNLQARWNQLDNGQTKVESRFKSGGVSMKQNHNCRQRRAALGLFCVVSLFASESYAAPAAITSRTTNIDGVQIHYLTA